MNRFELQTYKEFHENFRAVTDLYFTTGKDGIDNENKKEQACKNFAEAFFLLCKSEDKSLEKLVKIVSQNLPSPNVPKEYAEQSLKKNLITLLSTLPGQYKNAFPEITEGNN